MDQQYSYYDSTSENKGSVIGGLFGALIGALIGAAVWAGVAIFLQIISALIGFLIGFLAAKGYDLLKGPQGKVKIVCVILAIIVGVLVGTAATYIWHFHDLYVEIYGHLSGAASAFVPSEAEYYERLLGDSELTSEIIKNLLLGLLFAALGCFSLLRDMRSAGSGRSSGDSVTSADVSAAAVPVQTTAEAPTNTEGSPDENGSAFQ